MIRKLQLNRTFNRGIQSVICEQTSALISEILEVSQFYLICLDRPFITLWICWCVSKIMVIFGSITELKSLWLTFFVFSKSANLDFFLNVCVFLLLMQDSFQ